MCSRMFGVVFNDFVRGNTRYVMVTRRGDASSSVSINYCGEGTQGLNKIQIKESHPASRSIDLFSY